MVLCDFADLAARQGRGLKQTWKIFPLGKRERPGLALRPLLHFRSDTPLF
jgi:hypothetical protein